MKWQIPITSQRSTGIWVAHLMPESMDSDKLLKTACRMLVNPGFAISEKSREGARHEIRHCSRCERAAL